MKRLLSLHQLQLSCLLLTEFIPQLPTLVRHAGALLPPQRESRVGHELLRDERQHSGAVGVSHPQHLPHLETHGQDTGQC